MTTEQHRKLIEALDAGCDEDMARAHARVTRDEYAAWLVERLAEDPNFLVRRNDAEAAKRATAKIYTRRASDASGDILNSQLSLARGQQFLFVQEKDKDGRRVGKPSRVESAETIAAFLAGELDDEEDAYYFITAKEPDSHAIKDVLDRVHGKPIDRVDMTTKGDSLNSLKELSDEQLEKLTASIARELRGTATGEAQEGSGEPAEVLAPAPEAAGSEPVPQDVARAILG